MKISECARGEYRDFILTNGAGMTICLCSYGASIRYVQVPDRDGTPRIVTVCPQDEEIFRQKSYGKTMGRIAGRVEDACFTMGAHTVCLERNNHGRDNLHGGQAGWHHRIFGTQIKTHGEYTDVVFGYLSPDGDGGFFGEVKASVTYRVYERRNDFTILYDAVSDEKTPLSLTNHVYWNLSGDLRTDVRDHMLSIAASEVSRLNERLIYLGTDPVTPEFDFRTPRQIGMYVDTPVVQKDTHGYDHIYFLDTRGAEHTACTASCKTSGITLSIATTYPCVVFYGDNDLREGMDIGCGVTDRRYGAFCLECEYNSASVVHPPFAEGFVSPEKPYHEEIRYTFGIER